MSGCLIFQRPDICSTTSFESRRTVTEAGSRADAILSPRSTPRTRRRYWSGHRPGGRHVERYSLIVTDQGPRPATPGSPRLPPSASTINLLMGLLLRVRQITLRVSGGTATCSRA